MSPARYFVRSQHLLRRVMCGFLVATYLFVAAGIPLPTGSSPTNSGNAYPCATSGCGCDSAEKCWRSCCCHTLAERLAWAEKNRVKPPAFALAEAARIGLDSSGRPFAPKVVHVTLNKKSCGESKHCCCSSRNELTDKHQATTYVVAWRALGCHGQSLHWLAAVPTLIAVDLKLSDQLPLVAWLGPLFSEVAGGATDAPTPPPPERA